MRQIHLAICSLILLLAVSSTRSWAQQTMATSNVATTAVPHLMKFSGSVKDGSGKPLTGVAGLTFALYKDQEGGVALWIETQNVQLDSSGRYSTTLGASKAEGLPPELFASGEARWLSVQAEGRAEQPRVLLLSVPYALKAADAETIGGLPPSAFVLATPGTTPAGGAVAGGNTQAEAPTGTITGSGTANYVPLWTSTSNIANSVLYQSGSGGSAKLGINLTTPAATLDVNGTLLARGTLQLHSLGTATPSSGFNSNPVLFTASSFNSSKGKAISENFQWQAEPVGNDTPSPSGTLNLLFGASGTPAETGLNIASNGVINFTPGQTFPGAGTITGITPGPGLVGGGTNGNISLSLPITCPNLSVLQWNGSTWACSSAGSGTITGVIAGTDLTGGGKGGNVTLNLDTTKVPQLNAANNFTGNQTLNGHLTITGAFTDQLLNVVQKGTGTAIYGFATGTTGVNFGVSGASSSTSGVGVSGEGGTGVLGIGFNIGGMFSSNGWILQGTNQAGQVQFSEDASGNLSTTGRMSAGAGATIAANGLQTVIGDPGCGGSGTTALGFSNSGLSNCSNYALRGDTGGNLYINSSSTGWMFFDHNNNGSMSLDPSGNLGVQGNIHAGGAGNSFGISTDSNASQARTAGGWVKAMAYVDPFVRGGIAITRCYNSQASGAAVSTPPCGISITHVNLGTNVLDFGFEVDDRFVMLTVMNTVGNTNSVGAESCDATTCHSITTGNQIGVMSFYTPGQSPVNSYNPTDTPFYILVF